MTSQKHIQKTARITHFSPNTFVHSTPTSIALPYSSPHGTLKATASKWSALIVMLLSTIYFGTLIRHAPDLGSKAISDIVVGDRVASTYSAGDNDVHAVITINPKAWRKLTLKSIKDDGTVANVILLRPEEWVIGLLATEQENTVPLAIPEMGIDGRTQVLSIDACPAILPGEGQVVTGTFRHTATDLLDLQIVGEQLPIRATSNHPFWSEDRQNYVQASKLRVGEQLRTLHGNRQLTKISRCSHSQVVYNLEVSTSHTYHVGRHGILVHNSYAGRKVRIATGKNSKITTPTKKIQTWAQQGGYINPVTNKWVASTERLAADHVYPKSLIEKLPGFDKLSRNQKNFLLNYPGNFEPFPKALNSSKLNRLADDWAKTPMGSKASKAFINALRDRQQAFEGFAKEIIKFWNK